jgi:hypothetical protein
MIAAVALALSASSEDAHRHDGHEFMFNAKLPRNAVEITARFVPDWNTFWLVPPSEHPKNIPATCMLVEVYQYRWDIALGESGDLENQWILRFIGYTYMDAKAVKRLHNPEKNVSL